MVPSRRYQQLTPSDVITLLLEQFKDPGTIKCTGSGDTRLPDGCNTAREPNCRRTRCLIITELWHNLNDGRGSGDVH